MMPMMSGWAMMLIDGLLWLLLLGLLAWVALYFWSQFASSTSRSQEELSAREGVRPHAASEATDASTFERMGAALMGHQQPSHADEHAPCESSHL